VPKRPPRDTLVKLPAAERSYLAKLVQADMRKLKPELAEAREQLVIELDS
jgi:hypothetical protein